MHENEHINCPGLSYQSQLKLFVPQGLAVIFSHHQVCVRRRREDTFFAAPSESRISAPFFASKTV
jgi:hypothetical protein